MAPARSLADDGRPWSPQVGASRQWPVPGPVFGPYPLRDAVSWPASPWAAWVRALMQAPPRASGGEARRFVALASQSVDDWQACPAAQRPLRLARLRAALTVEGLSPGLAAQAMGLVAFHLRQQRGWSVHGPQWLGAWWMLGGRLIEMATGEGKSLAVVLAAATAALAGVPVHVMTANDYLARRDAESWRALYEALGLRVGWVVSDSTPDERRQAYRCHVTYVTAKEVAFDHLRDRAARAQGQGDDALVLRGLCMAVIDEADSILIDEACTPLVLSQSLPGREAEQRPRLALFLARQLQPGRDFDWGDGQIPQWRDEGRERLNHLASHLQGLWRLERYRHEQVNLALTALHLLVRDVHYLVRDDEVHIIDATTGRLAIGRSWSRGLHQMVSIKEQVAVPPETETLTQTTYQELLPRYHRLCGLSGTLWEERRELLAVYSLPVVRVPLRLPSLRRDEGLHVCDTVQAKWALVADRAAALAQQGRAVLVGTDSVADSERLSAVLAARGVEHQVLNARQDAQKDDAERGIVEAAGAPGAITVATHMAGRGTDIAVQPAVLERGGLHVINTHLNPSARVDRQLQGRAGRQGQPGSCECVLSWEDDTLKGWAAHPVVRWLLARAPQGATGPLRRAGLHALRRWIQWRKARGAFWARWSLLQVQEAMRKRLAWAGRDEWV